MTDERIELHGEGDLRRAMGSKRSAAKMERLRQRMYDGMAGNGITGELADTIYRRITAFAAYGFPESHAISFAVIAFASSWMKLYYPAAFLAALLRAQPMGFYSPQSLVADARRHGVITHRADINASLADATLEPDPASTGGHAVRLGLAPIRTISDDLAQRIVDERDQNGPYAELTDLTRRVRLTTPQAEALATAGVFARLGADRRSALWTAGSAVRDRPDMLPHTIITRPPPTLPGMSDVELAAADLWSTGVTPGRHPIEFVRDYLKQLGAVPAARLGEVEHGTRVLIGGIITHRQRPATASGVTFMNLEDETGMVNVVVSTGLWTRARGVARRSNALIIRGILERADGVITLNADHLGPLKLGHPTRSRDFR